MLEPFVNLLTEVLLQGMQIDTSTLRLLRSSRIRPGRRFPGLCKRQSLFSWPPAAWD